MTNPQPPPYSANVRAEVARAGRQQKDVAAAVGMTWSQWERRLRGDVDWRAYELDAIAHELQIPLRRLYERANGEPVR